MALIRCVFAPSGSIGVPSGVPASAWCWDDRGVASPAHSVAFDVVGYWGILLMAPSRATPAGTPKQPSSLVKVDSRSTGRGVGPEGHPAVAVCPSGR